MKKGIKQIKLFFDYVRIFRIFYYRCILLYLYFLTMGVYLVYSKEKDFVLKSFLRCPYYIIASYVVSIQL